MSELANRFVPEPLRISVVTESNGDVDYLLADVAIRDKLLTVEEVSETGSVPDLLVENRATFVSCSSRAKSTSEPSKTEF